MTVLYEPRQGPELPRHGRLPSAPLSVHQSTIVLSSSPSLLQTAENEPDVVVHISHRIADVTRAGLAREIRMRQRRKVHLRERIEEKERLACPDAPFHEVDALVCGFPVERAPAS